MRIDQSSVDISTLVDKVRRSEIDLQPSFQRGQVWAESKKRRLIDTILRQWYVPAIHIVVVDEFDREEILDGQQRLRAIIDFMEDRFTVDGRIEPEDEEIISLHGSFYSQLPERIKSKFRRFTITTVRLRDFNPEEPGELFFRLNQLTALTAAEQRNALIGAPRNQVRDLVRLLEEQISGYGIGFTNARMNFDDTIARVAIYLELGSLSEKVTASVLERRYRAGNSFPSGILDRIARSIFAISKLIIVNNVRTRLNKASLFSWLYFYSYYGVGQSEEAQSDFSEFFAAFEAVRLGLSDASWLKSRLSDSVGVRTLEVIASIFNDRASSRVNDTASVVLRDMCLAVSFVAAYPSFLRHSPTLGDRIEVVNSTLYILSEFPSDVAERAMAEYRLARQWESRRAIG